jgi:pimeloyl-ACP methyl ester carboxylesterase
VTVAGALLALPLVLALLAGGYLYTPDIPADVLEKKYAVPPSRFVEVDGLRVHYRDEGSGPVLVLIHGLTASLFDWDAWAERLRGRFRVIRLDLPGHGLTGPDPQGRYGWPAMADLVVRLLDRLGVDRAGVAGNSLGGAVAWQLAARHPDRVDRLILVAPVGYPIGGEMPFVLRLLANPVAGPLALRLTYRGAFADRVRATYGDPARFDPALADRQFELFRRAGNRGALAAMLGRGGPIPDPRPLLAGIRAPTLVMWGTADRIAPPGQAERFAQDIRGAAVARIGGAGHAPMIEAPDESAAAALAFLAGDAAAGPVRPAGSPRGTSARPAGG